MTSFVQTALFVGFVYFVFDVGYHISQLINWLFN